MKKGLIQVLPLVLLAAFAVTTLVIANRVQTEQQEIRSQAYIPKDTEGGRPKKQTTPKPAPAVPPVVKTLLGQPKPAPVTHPDFGKPAAQPQEPVQPPAKAGDKRCVNNVSQVYTGKTWQNGGDACAQAKQSPAPKPAAKATAPIIAAAKATADAAKTAACIIRACGGDFLCLRGSQQCYNRPAPAPTTQELKFRYDSTTKQCVEDKNGVSLDDCKKKTGADYEAKLYDDCYERSQQRDRTEDCNRFLRTYIFSSTPVTDQTSCIRGKYGDTYDVCQKKLDDARHAAGLATVTVYSGSVWDVPAGFNVCVEVKQTGTTSVTGYISKESCELAYKRYKAPQEPPIQRWIISINRNVSPPQQTCRVATASDPQNATYPDERSCTNALESVIAQQRCSAKGGVCYLRESCPTAEQHVISPPQGGWSDCFTGICCSTPTVAQGGGPTASGLRNNVTSGTVWVANRDRNGCHAETASSQNPLTGYVDRKSCEKEFPPVPPAIALPDKAAGQGGLSECGNVLYTESQLSNRRNANQCTLSTTEKAGVYYQCNLGFSFCATTQTCETTRACQQAGIQQASEAQEGKRCEAPHGQQIPGTTLFCCDNTAQKGQCRYVAEYYPFAPRNLPDGSWCGPWGRIWDSCKRCTSRAPNGAPQSYKDEATRRTYCGVRPAVAVAPLGQPGATYCQFEGGFRVDIGQIGCSSDRKAVYICAENENGVGKTGPCPTGKTCVDSLGCKSPEEVALVAPGPEAPSTVAQGGGGEAPLPVCGIGLDCSVNFLTGGNLCRHRDSGQNGYCCPQGQVIEGTRCVSPSSQVATAGVTPSTLVEVIKQKTRDTLCKFWPLSRTGFCLPIETEITRIPIVQPIAPPGAPPAPGGGGGAPPSVGGGVPSACRYGSTQARVQKDITDPWKPTMTVNCGSASFVNFNVGSFHNETGQFANDTRLLVTGPNKFSKTFTNGQAVTATISGTYRLTVTTPGQSGGGCTQQASATVINCPTPTPTPTPGPGACRARFTTASGNSPIGWCDGSGVRCLYTNKFSTNSTQFKTVQLPDPWCDLEGIPASTCTGPDQRTNTNVQCTRPAGTSCGDASCQAPVENWETCPVDCPFQ